MKGDIYHIARGNQRVQLVDKMSAIHLVSTLAILECTDPITSGKISGCKNLGQIYEVSFLDKAIKVAGLADAKMVADWMLSFGCKKVVLEKIEEPEDGED